MELALVPYATLAADPVGKLAIGPTWAYAYFDDAFSAIVVWGRLTGDDFAPTLAFAPIPVARGVAGHVALLDARRAVDIEATTFANVSEFLITNAAGLGAALSRVAIVDGGTLAEVLARGLIQFLHPAYAADVFHSVPDALAWLGRMDVELAIENMYTTATGVAPIVSRLRATLAIELRAASLQNAAVSLGMSARTLQRRLAESGTTFQLELDLLRIEAAKRLLRRDIKLDAIANEVGLASAANLTTVFRRIEGCALGEWRRRSS